MTGEGVVYEQMHQMFAVACRKAGLTGGVELSTAHFVRPSGRQLQLDLDQAAE
jgi:hypothetical protein